MTQPLTDVCEINREVVIRCIHRLENIALSAAENRQLYGLCYGEHGHHYKVQVTLRGPLDARSGQVIDRDRFERALEAAVVTPFDGVDLNQHFPNTACEALARAIYLRIEKAFPPGLLHRVGIQETRKNYFEFPPAD